KAARRGAAFFVGRWVVSGPTADAVGATAAGYGPEFLRRARRTCLHVATVIGDMTDDIVLVGGLVPSLIVAQGSLPSGAERHVGTMDVDVGLALGLLDEGRELHRRKRR
ncbi:MAG: hypothetical protein AB1726_01730, partial [Planctomycetota bacterium]